MLPSMMNKPFTRKRYPQVLDHGTATTDYSAVPVSVSGFYGSVQPGTGTVDQLNRDGAEIVFTIFARPNADVMHYDLIDLPDGTYFVNGEPARWGTGIMDHTVIQLSRWAG